MEFGANGQRFRGSKRRVSQMRLTGKDKWMMVWVFIIILVGAAAGGWMAIHFSF